MTIEETIVHCKEVAKESREAALSYARENAYETAISCKACWHEHEQLAEWLTELKQRREAEVSVKPKTNADRIRHLTDEELAEMVSMKVCRIVKPDGKDCPKGFYFGKCDKCVLNWLKQEVKTDDER